MTAPYSKEALDAESSGADFDLRTALISRFKLSPEKIRAVQDLMPQESLSFVDAALRLGFVTLEQIDDALDWAKRRQSEDSGGLIETAIRKISDNRQVVLAQGEMVRPGAQLILAHDSDNPRSEKIRALRTRVAVAERSP